MTAPEHPPQGTIKLESYEDALKVLEMLLREHGYVIGHYPSDGTKKVRELTAGHKHYLGL